MCLILFRFDPTSTSPLTLAANRDEFLARPTEDACFWLDSPHILAGKDLVAGGTWIGITKTGRFAAVTNVREPNVVVDNPLSRGDLTRHFLEGRIVEGKTESPRDYLDSIKANAHRYSGFNLLVGEFNSGKNELYYLSNRAEGIHQLEAGTYGLSNHLLDSAWPKVDTGKRFIDNANNRKDNNAHNKEMHATLRTFLEDDSLANDENLPATGVSYEREKALSAAFIVLPDYGTRTSTVITIQQNDLLFSEKHYAHTPQGIKATTPQFFQLSLSGEIR